jgi:hypothetical protein
VVRFDNGATGVAPACLEVAYGDDVRGEVFGSGGTATMGDARAAPAIALAAAESVRAGRPVRIDEVAR